MKFKAFVTAIIFLIVLAGGAAVYSATDRTHLPEPPDHVTVLLEQEGEILTLPYCDYITGCVFGLISPKSSSEAIRATALASTTMALWQLENTPPRSYMSADLSDDPRKCQPYLSPERLREEYGSEYEGHLAKIAPIVQEAIRYAIVYESAPIYAAVCRISAGTTDSGGASMPYLTSVPTEDKDHPEYSGSCAFTPETLRRTLKAEFPNAELTSEYSSWFTDPKYRHSGTLISVDYGGVSVSGEQLMELLGLRSAAVTIKYSEDVFRFSTKGSGCNIGMSVAYAETLARRSCTAEEILGYFYKDAKLMKL